jgi:eukaryotic-like serine/threonine-protein kinase
VTENFSPNTTLAHYRIISKIGAGGMGEVYLALDTKLNRRVALKVLPAEVASNRDRMERFVREAKSAAALNHPHIAQIHEIGEYEGTHFIVMEYIEGVSLREKIHSEQTELSKLLRYLQQAAEGLSKAHAAGIVHRDLKPDNIMITRDGFAKILDFGLAKLIEQQQLPGGNSSEVATAVMPQHSTPGTVMGTVGYMSPEQAQGKTKEIDQRSDIFSFGCILYEAITGTRPFEGDSVIKSLHMVIYEPAPPIAELNPFAPADVQRIVRRCLAKDPDERYQSIKEVAIELKELRRELQGAGIDTTVTPPTRSETTPSAGGEGTRSQNFIPTTGAPSLSQQRSSAEYLVSQIKEHKKGVLVGLALLVLVIAGVTFAIYKFAGRNEGRSIKSIAVLPFQNKSGDPNSEYLSDGLAESLIYRLSQLPDLKVSPTSSVIRYKGKDTEVSKIASELGVDAVMTGRLAQIGDNLTISVELVDVRNNKLLWGEQYDRKISDLLATQREIAAVITQKLQLRLMGGDPKGIRRYTESNEAYQLYLKGRFYFARRTKEELQRSIEAFDQAIKLDPNFALAYVGKAESYAVMPSFGYMSPREAMPQAKTAMAKALELDSELAEVHTILALIAASYDWNWTEAEREFKRAIELDPNLALAHYRYAWTYLSPMGRHDEAIAEMKRAMELEPLSLQQGANFASIYTYARQFDVAVEQARKIHELDPDFFGAQVWLAHAYNAKGMYAEAIALCEKSLQRDPTRQSLLRALGVAYAKTGRRSEAEGVIKQLEDIAKTQYVLPYYLATIYAALGDRDNAFVELEKAYAERDWFVSRVKVDPFLDPLRDDPRFKDLMRRMGLPQ